MSGFHQIPPHPVPPSHTSHIPLPTVTHAPPEFEYITKLGHRTLWVVFAVMLLSSLGFIFLSWRVAIQKRLFYQLTTFIIIIGTLSYYAMASGSGWSFHHIWVTHEHQHDIPDTHDVVLRQVFYARYIDWLFTTPLLLLNLAFLAGLDGSTIVNVVLADVIMILTGFFAAYGHSGKQIWGWYAMGWVAFLVIFWKLATSARVAAQKRGVQRLFGPLALYTVFILALYLIVWEISDGFHRLSPNQEVLAYAVLDILAKPVFGLWLLIAHQRMPASTVYLGGIWSEGFGHQEGILRVGDDEPA